MMDTLSMWSAGWPAMWPGALVLPAVVSLGITAANLVGWRAPGRGPRLGGRVSALVPARNEAANIDACLAALVRSEVDEILVRDDASSDDTAARISTWAARDPRVRLLRGEGPPPGWLGKAAACQALAEAASGDWLLFLDADVQVAPDVRDRLGAAAEGVEVVSALPAQVLGTAAEALGVPMVHLVLLGGLYVPAVTTLHTPRVSAAVGQVLMVDRDAFFAMGGFAPVRAEVLDDVGFCRAAKTAGLRVRLVDGQQIATCRMYRGGRELVDGFSKNLYAGLGGHPVSLMFGLGIVMSTWLLPWVAAAWAPVLGVGIVANLMQRGLLAWRFGFPAWTVLAHPASILLFIGVALRSAWWSWRGQARWRGRVLAEPEAGITQGTGRWLASTLGGMVKSGRDTVLAWWLAGRVRRGLDGLFISGLTGLRVRLARGPVLVVANHVGWWDGLVVFMVSLTLGADFRVVAGEQALERMPWLRWLGVMPLRAGLAARSSLRAVEDFLDRPGRLVWIFPQGQQRPRGVRPLGFRPGLNFLIQRLRRRPGVGVSVVPAAIDYPFRELDRPAGLVMLGRFIPVEHAQSERLEEAVVELLNGAERWADNGGIVDTHITPLVVAKANTDEHGLGARVLRWAAS